MIICSHRKKPDAALKGQETPDSLNRPTGLNFPKDIQTLLANLSCLLVILRGIRGVLIYQWKYQHLATPFICFHPISLCGVVRIRLKSKEVLRHVQVTLALRNMSILLHLFSILLCLCYLYLPFFQK